MKNISDMSLAEVTLAILKAAVNIPDGMYARAQFLASQELRALLNAPVPFPGYPPVPEDRKLPSAQPQGEPVAWQYRVSAGPQTGWSLWHDGKGEEFKRSYQVETRPLYAEQPAPVALVMPERVVLRDIIAQAIGGDAYDCTRVWSAWGVGTMSDDDFIPIVDQEERLSEIADACLEELNRLNPSL